MSRYTPTEVPLELMAGDQLELAAQHECPVTLKVKVGGYRAMLPMTKVQIDKLKAGGKSIRLTPAHLRYLKGRGMCGRGIFGDIGSAVGPAIGSAASAALSAIPGVGPIASIAGPLIGNAITGLTSAVGNEIDKSIIRRGYNEQQSAKNFNKAIPAAKAFLAMSPADQMAQYNRLKSNKLIKVGTFDSYYKRMAEQAQQSATTPEQQLQKKLAQKGYGAGQKKRSPMKVVAQKQQVSQLASDYIKAALEGRI